MTINHFTKEDDFRLWAFNMYYRAYKEELDLSKRFVRAIVESSKPVPAEMILAWRAARREIRKIDIALRDRQITREDWAKQIQAAILSHTGATVPDRAWVGESVDDLTPCRSRHLSIEDEEVLTPEESMV